MVRPNSILISGSTDQKTDYDFAVNPVLELYELADGVTVTANIPRKDGGFASSATVKRVGNRVTINLAGKTQNYTIFVSNAAVKNVNGGAMVQEQTERGAQIAASCQSVIFDLV